MLKGKMMSPPLTQPTQGMPDWVCSCQAPEGFHCLDLTVCLSVQSVLLAIEAPLVGEKQALAPAAVSSSPPGSIANPGCSHLSWSWSWSW